MNLKPMWFVRIDAPPLDAVVNVPTELRGETFKQLFDQERDRALTLAKGLGGSAVTILVAVLSAAIDGSVTHTGSAFAAAAAAVGLFCLVWAAWLILQTKSLSESYVTALKRLDTAP